MKKYWFIVIFLIFFPVTGCSTAADPTPAAEEATDLTEAFGFPVADYNWKYDFKATDEVIVERADAIQSGEIYVDSSINEPYVCDVQNIPWDVAFTKSPGTFSLYLLSLNPVAYLTQAYYITEDPDYLTTAKDILTQWIQYKNTETSHENPYLWYDHGTAIRCNNIIYFIFAYNSQPSNEIDSDFCSLLMDILKEHGQHLSNEKEYFAKHNHGIFQDQALIYLSCFLDDQESTGWLALAKERIEGQKEYAFSDEMVHVENSPAYQIGVVELFYQIAEFLSTRNDPFGSDLYQDVMQSLDFLAWAVKPNGLLAEAGDTSSQKGVLTAQNQSLTKYGNEHLSYSATLGEAGTKPETLSAYYPHSGYYFGRSSWDSENYTDSTWTMFKAGYLSRTHKHADDASFMLYAKGYDILVDPGWYNYMTGNTYRDYFVSSHAHNTVIVDDKSYSPTVENSSKTGFFSYGSSGEWDTVLAYNNMYDDVQIDRHFYYGGDTIVLVDDIKSPTPHRYSQLFHLSEYMTIASSDDAEVTAFIGDSGYKLKIRQFSGAPSLEIINGGDTDAAYGYLSRTMNDLEYINTLKWDMEGTNAVFVTVITIEAEDGSVIVGQNRKECRSDEIRYDADAQMLSFSAPDAVTCIWQSRERPSFDHIDTQIVQNTITLANHIPNGELWSYAWYLIDMETAEVIERLSYSSGNTASFVLNEDGTYLIKAYLSSAQGSQRVSSIIAAIEKNGDQVTDVTDLFPYLNLEYLGQEAEQISEDTWEFTVHYDYSWNSSIAWYIYKDGGIYFSENTANTDSRQYQFSEPGSYTVMYYLRTPNGDNYFYNFEEIIID